MNGEMENLSPSVHSKDTLHSIQSEKDHEETSIKHEVEEEGEHQQPFAFTDSDKFSEDLQKNNGMSKDQKLARKNKKYLDILKQASTLFNDNQSKQYAINNKKAQLEQYRSILESKRRQKKEEIIKKKDQISTKKKQLQKEVQNQSIRITDLSFTLQLLEELNSKEATHIYKPEVIHDFQNFINQQYTRLKQNRNSQKNILLDNLLNIQSELIKQ